MREVAEIILGLDGETGQKIAKPETKILSAGIKLVWDDLCV